MCIDRWFIRGMHSSEKRRSFRTFLFHTDQSFVMKEVGSHYFDWCRFVPLSITFSLSLSLFLQDCCRGSCCNVWSDISCIFLVLAAGWLSVQLCFNVALKCFHIFYHIFSVFFLLSLLCLQRLVPWTVPFLLPTHLTTGCFSRDSFSDSCRATQPRTDKTFYIEALTHLIHFHHHKQNDYQKYDIIIIIIGFTKGSSGRKWSYRKHGGHVQSRWILMHCNCLWRSDQCS